MGFLISIEIDQVSSLSIWLNTRAHIAWSINRINSDLIAIKIHIQRQCTLVQVFFFQFLFDLLIIQQSDILHQYQIVTIDFMVDSKNNEWQSHTKFLVLNKSFRWFVSMNH